MKLASLLSALFIATTAAVAQPEDISSSDKWWTYIADYDGKPGSTRVDMGLHAEAPLKTLPVVVIFGVKYDAEPKDGFPSDQTLDRLNKESDDLIRAVLRAQPGMYVGTFTHMGEQVHYVYVASADRTEEAFRRVLRSVCETCVAVYRTKDDPEWKAYRLFLYPNQATLDYYGLDPRTLRGRR